MANYYSYNTNQVQADINMDNAIKDIQNQLLNIPTDSQLGLKANQTDLDITNANVATNATSLADITTNQLPAKASQTSVTNQKYFISIKEFPRNTGETDDTPRIQRALNSLTNGGILVFEIAEYLLASTVTIPQNVTIQGQGCGKWVTGTGFRFVGTSGGTAFNFATNSTAGIRLQNFKIYANSGDPAYRAFTGIEVNQSELTKIKDVLIQYANIGIDVSGRTNDVYLLDIDTIYIYNCANEGILFRSTGTWKQGNRIKVGDISSNNIGIHCMSGNGNTIIGNGSEMGQNVVGAILVEGGNWTIEGNLWIESNATNSYGIQTTGGHTSVLGEIYCTIPINQVGGSLYIPNKQMVVNRVSPSMIKRGLTGWFSFEEGSGNSTYDRTSSLKGTISGTPTWNADNGRFGSTVNIQAGTSISIPLTLINWTQDWTFLFLGKGTINNNFMYLQGSDVTKTNRFYVYANGVQIWQNGAFKSNLATYPNGDATLNNNWHIVSYKASTTTITAYNQVGKAMATYVMTIDPTLNAPTSFTIGNGCTVDEFILYSRVLTDSEIRAICEMTIPPDVRNLNHKVMTSPDGSMWKQTIDNTGVATWVKL